MTLREIHERCKTRHSPHPKWALSPGDAVFCECCNEMHPCPDYSDAVAALALLDESFIDDEVSYTRPRYRLVRDDA